MGEFSHPAAQSLLEKLKNAFTGTVFEKRTEFFLFVCGGPVDGKDLTLRRQFLDWSERELPDFVVILAEDAFRQTRSQSLPRSVNLGIFEALIAGISDFVLIFPESPGSFSEAGFFCNSPGIPKKTIIANDSTYRAEESFLNLGPLRSIDSKSNFSPRIEVRVADPLDDFSVIKKKLEEWRKGARRQRFAYAPYKQLGHKQRLFVVLELLHLLRLVTLEDLRFAVKATFGPVSVDNVGRMLSILVGAKYAIEIDGRYSLAKNRETMLEFDVTNKEDLIARVTEYYQRHRPELYEAIRTWAST
jgi:hypothetical protein